MEEMTTAGAGVWLFTFPNHLETKLIKEGGVITFPSSMENFAPDFLTNMVSVGMGSQ